MNPNTLREIKKRQRYFNNYLNDLTEGKISKKFKPTPIDLVQEFWDNKEVIHDFQKELEGIEEKTHEEGNEPFNLINEREELLFDKGGNMQLLRERVDVTDPWLESIENDPLAVIKNEEEQKETQNFDV